ncbi:sensor histidine kinase [Massilia horti]|uniref:Histidine kinase n=1 Tax=Massilia horti TaxID=2562153 RepID=A0A4Y9SNB9_9BURK|nr:histidine kinase [Massilia horti]TFW27951.1 histidine kinase [Massilia horti]
MSAKAPSLTETELDRQVAARTAELSELLSHLMASWDDERRQLARQMHDSLGSSMTALTMHLALLTRQLPADNQALHDRAAQMKQLLTTVIETNRKMQIGLWNDKLEFLGVKAALSEVIAAFKREHQLAVHLSLPDEEVECSRAHGVALLRCVEEGLRNVVAHAQASEVDVILDDDGEHLMLTVRDNGVGPGAAGLESINCHGLRLLRARAWALGGTLTLGPGNSGGTALTMILPKGSPA